jgi:hypothetical protein
MKAHQADEAFEQQLKASETAKLEAVAAAEAAAASKQQLQTLVGAAKQLTKTRRQEKGVFDTAAKDVIAAYAGGADEEEAYLEITVKMKGTKVLQPMRNSHLFPENSEGLQLTFSTKTHSIPTDETPLQLIANGLGALVDLHAGKTAGLAELIAQGKTPARVPNLISAIVPKIGRVLAVQQDAASSEDSKPV